MAQYKVIQDIEAEDKLVGPLSLRQFIYAGIAALCFYLSFLMITKHAGFLAIIFVPIGCASGFFAFPWGKDQPTEIWALAKIRFLLKPRKRIWDQSGVKELVTITVPKTIDRALTNGLSQHEVHSRLQALADTIDSRGWAVKNVNVNTYNHAANGVSTSDRLVDMSAFPQEVPNIDVQASDDIMDEAANPVAHHFDDMINASSQAKRQELLERMQEPEQSAAVATAAPNDYWFMQQPIATGKGQAAFGQAPVVSPGTDPAAIPTPQAAVPTPEEQAMVEKFKAENGSMDIAYGRMKVLRPLSEQNLSQPQQTAAVPQPAPVQPQLPPISPTQVQPLAPAGLPPQPPKATVTPAEQAAIINLAQNDDLDVATIARQAHLRPSDRDGKKDKRDKNGNNEVVISLR